MTRASWPTTARRGGFRPSPARCGLGTLMRRGLRRRRADARAGGAGGAGDRLTAAWALAAGTGVWLLAVDTFSLLPVRQVPAADALRAAARLQPLYIAAALAGAGGALLGRS